MTKEHDRLRTIVSSIIDGRRDREEISPLWVATEATKQIGAWDLKESVPLVYEACHLHLRQVARSLCRALFEVSDGQDAESQGNSAQHQLFPDLQWRYPRAPAGSRIETSYVLLEQMTDADIRYNVQRLKREARARLGHADALHAWAAQRQRTLA